MSLRSTRPFLVLAVVVAAGLAVARGAESLAAPPAAPVPAAPVAAPAAPPVELVEPSPRSAARTTPRPAVVVAVDPATGALVRADNRAAAGRRTPVEVAPVAHGIRCPDGAHLPLLNGVEGAPPLQRAEERGPLPPVVAVVVDRDGWDWYEHADGSTTTCRPHTLIGEDGRTVVHVVTLHNAPDATMREIDPALPPTGPRNR